MTYKQGSIFAYIFITFMITSCARSMSPMEINEKLPRMTISKFITSHNQSENCVVLQSSRKYNAPIGLTVNQDLKNGAKGIDEWVRLDGGNAYRLVNYQWIQVDDHGSTQLLIEFDTLKCE